MFHSKRIKAKFVPYQHLLERKEKIIVSQYLLKYINPRQCFFVNYYYYYY